MNWSLSCTPVFFVFLSYFIFCDVIFLLSDIFGLADGTYYTPLAAQNYLREAGSVTIVRVAGVNGYQEKGPLVITAASGSVTASVGVLFNTDKTHSLTTAPESVVSLNSGDFSIDLSDKAKGVYYISIVAEKSSVVLKAVVR